MTIDTHTMSEQAKALGFDTPTQIAIRLVRIIARNQHYLQRRAARGTRTAYDEALAEDSLCIARAIELLQDEPALVDCPYCHGAHYTGQVCPLKP